MTTLLSLNLVAVAIFAWFSIFKVVPSYATSRCRYRLWQLRDELADSIRNGEFETPDAARRIVSVVELAIEDAEDLSALNVRLFYWVSRDERLSNDPFHLTALSTGDARSLRKALSEFESALLAKTLLGSPSGWLMTLFLTPVVAISAIRTNERPPVLSRAAKQIGNDLLRSNQLDGPHDRLYQHV